jgi:hypothetical protein
LIGDISIITKSGILVFNHTFSSQSSEGKIDVDMRASLLTAILTFLRETQRETITAIRHSDDYVLMLYEGVLSFGIFPTREFDIRSYRFLREAVLKFELMFTEDLHRENVLNRSTFESFRDIISELYSKYNQIDIIGLQALLRFMDNIPISNYIIFESKSFHRIFSSFEDQYFSNFKDAIGVLVRQVVDFGTRISHNMTEGEFLFNGLRICFLQTSTHLFVFLRPGGGDDRISFNKELTRIKKYLVSLVT